jgi:hypothetical protein
VGAAGRLGFGLRLFVRGFLDPRHELFRQGVDHADGKGHRDLAGPSSLPVKLADVLILPAANRPPNRSITSFILPRRDETIPRCGTQADTFFHPTAVANECVSMAK